MAQSLSYKEAVSKGLVYPGAEESALKLTGGGKGFASTEAYKKAFQSTYQQRQGEIQNYTSQIQKLNKEFKTGQKAVDRYRAMMGSAAIEERERHSTDNYYTREADRQRKILDDIVTQYGGRRNQLNYSSSKDEFSSFINKQIQSRLDAQKKLSSTMKTAMAKYEQATKEAVTAEKRETESTKAARRRLTRGTAGLLAKAGAGGMVGTGLPDLGTGMGGGLGIDDQLGRKVTL